MRRIWISITLTIICMGMITNAFTLVYATADEPTFHFGFQKSRNGKLPSIDAEGFKSIMEKYGAIFLGDPKKKNIYLTFDNGYENGLTGQILDTLKAKKVPTIFFVTGHYIQTQPELLKRMVAENHLIGNHSWHHPNMTIISDKRMRSELDRVKQAVASITGVKEMPYMRPPSGTFNERVLAFTKEMGYTNVFWSIAYKDWDVNAQRGASYAYDKVIKQLHPGAIILLHATSKDNANALGDIIDQARQQGYKFARLDQLHLSS